MAASFVQKLVDVQGPSTAELELPIDINYTKLADWLVDRKKVPSDWRKKLSTVHRLRDSALQTLPKTLDPSFLTLSPETAGYLESKQVREALKTLNPEAKDLFGRLSGAAGQWDAVVKGYEKEALFLGEAALDMVRLVNYEIPYQRKQIGRLQQQLTDLDKKEAEFRKNAGACAQRYKQECEELGIKGVKVRSELLGLSRHLPMVFNQVVSSLCSKELGETGEYYRAFVEYAHTDDKEHAETVLSTLSELRASPPEPLADDVSLQVISEDQSESSKPQAKDTPAIDWGLDGSETTPEAPPVSINWDLDISELSGWQEQPTSGAPGINWDVEVSGEDSNNLGGNEMGQDGPPGINWDIDVSSLEVNDSSASETPQMNWDIEIPQPSDGADLTVEGGPVINWDIDLTETADSKGPGESTGNVCGERKETQAERRVEHPLSKTEYRRALLDDLFELRAFLNQRVSEMESEEASGQLAASAPPLLQQATVDSVRALEREAADAIGLLTNRKTRDLIMITHSPKLLDRLQSSLEQRRGQERKSLEGIAEVEQKRQELRSTLAATWPAEKALVARVRQIKQEVEQVLSQQYNGRTVNIIGEINNVLGVALS